MPRSSSWRMKLPGFPEMLWTCFSNMSPLSTTEIYIPSVFEMVSSVIFEWIYSSFVSFMDSMFQLLLLILNFSLESCCTHLSEDVQNTDLLCIVINFRTKGNQWFFFLFWSWRLLVTTCYNEILNKIKRVPWISLSMKYFYILPWSCVS